MDKIQEALYKWQEKCLQFSDEEKTFVENNNDCHEAGWFYAGYKAGAEAEREKLKCCGSCKWCETISACCENEKSEEFDSQVYLDVVCDKWEARE